MSNSTDEAFATEPERGIRIMIVGDDNAARRAAVQLAKARLGGTADIITTEAIHDVKTESLFNSRNPFIEYTHVLNNLRMDDFSLKDIMIDNKSSRFEPRRKKFKKPQR